MGGIYIHIPFCKQACHYCDFHFSTSLKRKSEMVQAILQECALRKNYLKSQGISSIYLGGGTPSLLSYDELMLLFDGLAEHFTVDQDAEITLEANPDDLDVQSIAELAKSPVNRLSIGIQSFHDEELQWMNRAHNAEEAKAAILRSQDAGLDQISMDLIFGLPISSSESWAKNLSLFFDLEVPHLSAYQLTVEEKTALHHSILKGKSPDLNDDQIVAQYHQLQEAIQSHQFEQYEVSNYCRDQQYAVHNTSYWKGIHYLGLGPSAHSFNGTSRQWNIAHNVKYLQSISEGKVAFEIEELNKTDRFNEMILTGLRTKWGIDLLQVKKEIGTYGLNQLTASIQASAHKEHFEQDDYTVRLKPEAFLISDRISSDLMV